MDQTVFEATFADGKSARILAWYAENPEPSEKGNAAIGYAVFPDGKPEAETRGNMLYDAAEKIYDQIADVREDLKAFLANALGTEIIFLDPTDIDPAAYM